MSDGETPFLETTPATPETPTGPAPVDYSQVGQAAGAGAAQSGLPEHLAAAMHAGLPNGLAGLLGYI